MDGILTKGLTESLQHFIRNIQAIMLFFDDAKSLH